MLSTALAIVVSVSVAPPDGTRRAPPRAGTAADDDAAVRVAGSLGPVTPLRRADGGHHAAAVLRPDGAAAPLLVDLGPARRAQALGLRAGQRVIVRGRPGLLSGQPALLAESVERAGGAAPADPTAGVATGLLGGPRVEPPRGAPAAAPPVALGHTVYEGTLDAVEEVTHRGRRLLRVRLRGRVLLVDAPRWVLEALRPREGDRLGVAGRLVALGGRPVIVADVLWIGGGEAVTVPRRARAVEAAVTTRAGA
ncbi:MAG: hypothetical protein M9894_06830 [Planctomycetes bacterium]|nr:hypothetical protein [Planctomycetota bacterium]